MLYISAQVLLAVIRRHMLGNKLWGTQVVHDHLRSMLLLKETVQVAHAYLHPRLESISQGFACLTLHWHVGPTSARSSCLRITRYSISLMLQILPGEPQNSTCKAPESPERLLKDV